MSKTRTILSRAIFLSLIAALVLSACASSTANTSTTSVGVVTSVNVTDTVQTSGSLSADKLGSLKWNTSGIVEKVNVKVGDKISTNDVLASLRSDSVPSTIGAAQSDLATAQRTLDDMLASGTSLAQAQLAVVNARKAVEVAQNVVDALPFPRASDALIKNTQAQIWAAQKTLTLDNSKYKEVQNHPDGDPQKTAALIALTSAQLAYNNLVVLYNWYTGKPTQADIDQADANLDVARAALDDARRTRDNVKSGADPLQVASNKAKVAAAQATINQMLILAPFDAEVISVQAGAGNTVNLGDLAIEVVDRSTLKVETLVDDSSISAVAVGNPAAITMDSLPGVTLTGKVVRISRIGSVVNGLVKYTVGVAIDPTTQPILFGTTVNVVITTGAPHTSLAVPVGAVFSDTQGEYIMLVDNNGNTKRVKITSGDLINSQVTITPATASDVQAGYQVEVGSGTSSGTSGGTNRNNGGGFFGGPGG